MILFQPCPAHFPDLWKVEHLAMPELTSELVQRAREMYHLPEDGTKDAAVLYETWGVNSTQVVAEAYAKLRFRSAHGFLVENGRLVHPRVHLSIDDLEFFNEHFDLKLEEACFERARAFSLPEKTPRDGMASSIARSERSQTICLPNAQKTWPPHPAQE